MSHNLRLKFEDAFITFENENALVNLNLKRSRKPGNVHHVPWANATDYTFKFNYKTPCDTDNTYLTNIR